MLARRSDRPGPRRSPPAYRMHARAFLALSLARGSIGGRAQRGCAGSGRERGELYSGAAGSRRLRVFRYPAVSAAPARAGPRSTALSMALLDMWGCLPLPLSPLPALSLTLFSGVRRSEIRSRRSMNAGIENGHAGITRVRRRHDTPRGGRRGWMKNAHRSAHISDGISSEKERGVTPILYFYNTRCAVPP